MLPERTELLKTTVIYHSADYDGIFCREIAKKFLGTDNVQYIGWNFGDYPIFTDIPPLGDIYFLDLPVDAPMSFCFDKPETVIERFGDIHGIKEFNRRLTWIDHHKTAIDSHPAEIVGYRIDGVAACRLAWQWFSAMGTGCYGLDMMPPELPDKADYVDRLVTEPLAVRLAGEYDVAGPSANEEALNFQFGLRSTEIAGDEEQLLTIGEFGDKLVAEISERGTIIRAYLERIEKFAAQNAFKVVLDGLTFLATNGHRANCKAFSERAAELGCDGLMGFCFDGKEWAVSLYHAKHRTDLDLSQIAKKHGGGGHRGACGFTCAALPWLGAMIRSEP